MQFLNPFKNAKLYRYPYGDVLQLFGESPELYQQHTSLGIIAHNGIDLYQPYGTPLLAVCNGVIADIKFSPEGYGRHIRLISDWEDGECFEVTYGHLAEIKPFKIGDRVTAGDVLGTCGNSGFVVSQGVPYWGDSNPDKRGTHLHFGVRRFTEKPTPWLVQYPFSAYFVDKYTNGYCGAINPMPFFNDEIEKQARSVIELAKRVIAQVKLYFKI